MTQSAEAVSLIPLHRGQPCASPNKPTDPTALKLAAKIHAQIAPLGTILFGSRARGDHREGASDVDILLIQKELPSSKEMDKADDQAQGIASRLYQSTIKCQLVWLDLKDFQKGQPFINSLTTRALLDGYVFTEHPETFKSPYHGDNPSAPLYDWTPYQFHLNRSRESVAILKSLLDPSRAYDYNCSYPSVYYLHDIPNMTREQRWRDMPHEASKAMQETLDAVIHAAGEYSHLFDTTLELSQAVSRLLPHHDLETSLPISAYLENKPPHGISPPRMAAMAINDVTKTRKLAMRLRRETGRTGRR